MASVNFFGLLRHKRCTPPMEALRRRIENAALPHKSQALLWLAPWLFCTLRQLRKASQAPETRSFEVKPSASRAYLLPFTKL
mmetsp:Transcript_42277/g.75752  ORF Transcript_42277/g.75752 Transcript_42277/m.75752 type:complete len:82 (+) Transcript_42277:91-336(+)